MLIIDKGGEKMNRKALVFSVLLLLLVPMFSTAVVQACHVQEKHNDKCTWHTIPAYQTSNLQVTYAQLTDYCLNVWGLSQNPYPTYPADVKAYYYIITLMIGHDALQIVSCSSRTNVYDPNTKTNTFTYDTVWYVGDWGKENARMNQGFEGTIIIQLQNYNPIAKTWDYYTGQFNFLGFHRFNHQTLLLTIEDSRLSELATGICQVLGNRDKN
jgi:hypothetical protein